MTWARSRLALTCADAALFWSGPPVNRGQPTRRRRRRKGSGRLRGNAAAPALVLACGSRAAVPGSNVNMDPAETMKTSGLGRARSGGTRTPNLLIRRHADGLAPGGLHPIALISARSGSVKGLVGGLIHQVAGRDVAGLSRCSRVRRQAVMGRRWSPGRAHPPISTPPASRGGSRLVSGGLAAVDVRDFAGDLGIHRTPAGRDWTASERATSHHLGPWFAPLRSDDRRDRGCSSASRTGAVSAASGIQHPWRSIRRTRPRCL